MSAAGGLDDLFEFDTTNMSWEKISESSSGPSPPSRFYHQLTACEGIIYLFGGQIGAGHKTVVGIPLLNIVPSVRVFRIFSSWLPDWLNRGIGRLLCIQSNQQNMDKSLSPCQRDLAKSKDTIWL